MNNFRKWTCNTNNERLKAVKMFIKDHGLSLQYYKFNAIMMSHKNTKHSSVISTWSLDHYFYFFWRLILLSSHLFFIFRQYLFIFSPFVVLWILKDSEILWKSTIQLNIDWISIGFMISLEQQQHKNFHFHIKCSLPEYSSYFLIKLKPIFVLFLRFFFLWFPLMF